VHGSSGVDFRRQLAERAGEKPQKKFKSSAPKGVRLAAGYTDRTKDRVDDDEDDKAKRIKALEETMKLGQIDEETFTKLRDEIAGGDISSTYLVKGLDRKLLERVKRGEDVYNNPAQDKSDAPPPDIDDEFEKIEETEVAPVVREKSVKKGEMAGREAPPQVAGVKRSRDEILAEWKAQRKAAVDAKAASLHLGSKFRKIGEKKESSRIEIDDKGREVLIVVDNEGNVKRKVRKPKAEVAAPFDDPATASNKMVVLGADVEVPEAPSSPSEDEDDDIFEGVGKEYDPLGDLDDDDTSSSEEEGEEKEERTRVKKPLKKAQRELSASSQSGGRSPSAEVSHPKPAPSARPRNYFNDKPSAEIEEETRFNPLTDKTVLAALLKTRATAEEGKVLLDPEEEARRKKRDAMLAAANRDFDDLDMGFGESRFEDAEELEEGERVKLSEWKGAGGDDDEGGERTDRAGKKRKRGPKKKKGDKNSASDVLKVLERRKGGS
jgi:hypothetical protein